MRGDPQYEKVRKIVKDIAYYVGQGLTTKEADTFTRRVMRVFKEQEDA